jgi:hypothetical protein
MPKDTQQEGLNNIIPMRPPPLTTNNPTTTNVKTTAHQQTAASTNSAQNAHDTRINHAPSQRYAKIAAGHSQKTTTQKQKS